MKNKILIIIIVIILVVAFIALKINILGNNSNMNLSHSGSSENNVNANSNSSKNVNATSENSETDSDNPYIPKGFSYLEGEVDSGYTIEDSYGNQYVWVPVKSGAVKRSNESNSNYEEKSSSALELVNSAGQNHGFYVAKYEASSNEIDGNETIASVNGKYPINNITFIEASGMCSEVSKIYNYKDCRTAIMNSYAWDTMLKWIDNSNEGYSSSTDCGNYSNEISKTGETESDIKNNICDLAGNLREWTTEIYKSKKVEKEETNSVNNSANEIVIKDNTQYRVVRGGSINLETTPSSRNKYKENTSNEYWGFRVILYKK